MDEKQLLLALAVLDLGPSATCREVEEAYRSLAKVWHPDRFMQDATLRQKAEQKQKQLNDSVEFLRNHWSARQKGFAKSETPVAYTTNKVSRSRVEAEPVGGNKLDLGQIIARGTPWNQRVGGILSLVCGLGFAAGVGYYLNDPGQYKGFVVSLSAVPVLVVAEQFGLPIKRAKGNPQTVGTRPARAFMVLSLGVWMSGFFFTGLGFLLWLENNCRDDYFSVGMGCMAVMWIPLLLGLLACLFKRETGTMLSEKSDGTLAARNQATKR